MDSDISTALSLLAIGMTTVFIVLLLVVATGNILIRFVNSISPNNDQLTSDKGE
jgi:Na+-transporting methylmalonyl-CoA/oxaloacetate decarboxylase gamma subunit